MNKSSKKKSPKGDESEPQPSPPPLRPRPKLFVFMSAVLLILLAGLLTLYFKTVYPERSHQHVVETDNAELPTESR